MDSPNLWLIKRLNSAVAEATVYPWKESKNLHAKTVQQVCDLLRAHKPATVAR